MVLGNALPRVTNLNVDARLGQELGCGRGGAVGALNLKASVFQHKGKRAHPGATNPYQEELVKGG